MPDLEKLANEYAEQRAAGNAAETKKEKLRDQILEALGKEKSATCPGFSIEISEREKSEIDEEYLEQNLPEDTWLAITSRRLDPLKVLEAIQAGELSPDLLTPATNRAKELVKKFPHKLVKKPLPGTLAGDIQMSSVAVKLEIRTDEDGSVIITGASEKPPFQVSYRHDGITRVLNVKAVKDAAPKFPFPVSGGSNNGW